MPRKKQPRPKAAKSKAKTTTRTRRMAATRRIGAVRAPDPRVCDPDERLIGDDIVRHLVSAGNDFEWAGPNDFYTALANTVRERLADKWLRTQRAYYDAKAKRVYYLSMEFLPGRSLMTNLINLGLEDECRQALAEFGLDLDDVAEQEWDAGLGNGGLGRLASCLLESMATLGIPAYGYGIRYDFGIFYQLIEDGWQMERPDNWLRFGNAWEFQRPQHLYPVDFFGQVSSWTDDDGRLRHTWEPGERVMAMACDMLVPGHRNENVINMRLWAARSSRELDLASFHNGQYIQAIEGKAKSENISKVLYPNDHVAEGMELRLKQQYFFVAATFQDILRRYHKHHRTFTAFPDHVAVQLNDTHPAIAIPELMRLLVDVELVPWDTAWDLCTRTFGYTNHTVLPEALETWPADLMERVLPRHAQIIYEINRRFLDRVREAYPGDEERVRRMSLVDDGGEQRLRMANLAVVGSHSVNGVAELHSEIIRSHVFRDLAQMFPDRFCNVTNGITPRVWLRQANPDLAALITEAIGEGWLSDLQRLKGLVPLADDAAFRRRWAKVKHGCKKRLSDYIWSRTQVRVDWDSLYDIQVKRIHEYKRQLLNVLHIVTLYNRLRDGVAMDGPPRTFVFGGKAAPAYDMAKLTIKLINDVAAVVNADPVSNGFLRVAFVPNYCVSNATKIIPAADLSEQISLAGMEASGTGNMKFALNGALTIGTLDGANVEIRQAVGEENFFVFGMDAREVEQSFKIGYIPHNYYESDQELRRAVDGLAQGMFCPDDPGRFLPVVRSLLEQGDRYRVLADYRPYVQCQEEAGRIYMQPDQWVRRSILNAAGMGWFSSDRTVAEYARGIWGVSPVETDGGC